MKTSCILLLAPPVLLAAGRLAAQNIVPNPGFEGAGGQDLPIGGGIVNAPAGVPDSWRAFAVGARSAIDLEIVPVGADELYPGSPATNAVLLRVNGFAPPGAGDQGFDDDIGRFPITPGLDYHAEFYVKSANADASSQPFNFGFPLFNKVHKYQGIEPGGSGNDTATPEWALFTGPVFRPREPVAEGHISWRAIDDGGENAILLALPSVTFEGLQVLPSDLACDKSGPDVKLAWVNHASYDSLKLLRDGAEIAALAVDATSHTDAAPPDGVHQYQVLAALGPESDGPTCEVAVFGPPAAGTTASVDLNDVDIEAGLKNTFRDAASDGENTFAICGPASDLREGRSNWGAEDPTPDFPDSLFYFTVSDPAMKAQSTFRLEVTAYDDPALAGANLYLQYTNQDSTGPTDIPNTFFPVAAPPLRALGGTDEWIVVSWDVENAGFRSFQQGVADFRVGLRAPGASALTASTSSTSRSRAASPAGASRAESCSPGRTTQPTRRSGCSATAPRSRSLLGTRRPPRTAPPTRARTATRSPSRSAAPRGAPPARSRSSRCRPERA